MQLSQRKLKSLIRKLNSPYGEERYMHRNNKIYKRDIKKDIYRVICDDENVEILIKEEK